MENLKLLKDEEIVVFNWLDTLFGAFELYFSTELRLRVNKKAIWRLSRDNTILYSSARRKSDKFISAMRDLLEEKKVKKITEKPNGDIILYLSGNMKLELFKMKADDIIAEIQ